MRDQLRLRAAVCDLPIWIHRTTFLAQHAALADWQRRKFSRVSSTYRSPWDLLPKEQGLLYTYAVRLHGNVICDRA